MSNLFIVASYKYGWSEKSNETHNDSSFGHSLDISSLKLVRPLVDKRLLDTSVKYNLFKKYIYVNAALQQEGRVV